MEQQEQQQSVGEGSTSQQRPQQESVSEGGAGRETHAAGAVWADSAASVAVPSSRRSSAGSVSSNKSPTKAGGGGGSGSTAPSSPKRASVGSSGSSGGQPDSPGKRQSASSMAAAPRIGAPLPPAPRASGGGPGSLQTSPRKMPKGGSSSRAALPERQKSVSESNIAAAMAGMGSEASSSRREASAESNDVSRSMSVPSIAPEAVEVALSAAAAASTTGQPNRPSPAHDMPLAPRSENCAQPCHPPLPNPASSAPSSATSTPVLQAPQVPPALAVGALPPHLSPPLFTAASATTLGCSPASNPVSPSVSMGGHHAAGTGPVACPSLPSLPPPVAQDGVVLGVEALERQQAELERKRLQAAADAQTAAKAEAERQRALAQAQHLEQMQREAAQAQAAVQQRQHRARTQSLAMAQAPPSSGLPPRSASTPPPMTARPEAGPQDDDTAPSSTCPQPPPGEGTPNQPRRTSSFGRFLKTPLKQLRQSSFYNESETGASSGNKHGSDALVVPPKDVNGLLEVEGIWQEDEVKPLVYGYLRKLGRNGQWQKRWFETDGMHLTYYKSRKRTKLLASLDLCHVGAIQIDNTDPSGCTFTIQVADRPYFLSAASEPLCKHWVINLNRVKEARCQVGGFQLVEPRFHHGDAAGADGTDRQRTESDECMAPRVVMVANRNRTRAMAPSETEDAMMEMLRQSEEKKADEDAMPLGMDVGVGGPDTAAGGAPPHRPSSAPPLLQEDQGEQLITAATAGGALVAEGAGQPQALTRTNSPRLNLPVLARWHKRRGTLTKLSLRLLRWARSMKVSTKCITDENAVMGSPVHPPGRPVGDENFGEHGLSSQPGTHDATETSDSSQRLPGVGASFSFEGGHAEWINKEKQKHIQSSRMHSGDADQDGTSERVIQSVASGGSASVAVQSAATAGEGYESEEETRELS